MTPKQFAERFMEQAVRELQKADHFALPRRQAGEPFGGGRVADPGRPSVPAARLAVILGDAVAF
jgi:hypothetical protein